MDAFVSPTLQAHFAKLSGGLSSSPATNSSYDAAFAYPHAHLGLTHAPGVALPNASGRLAPTPVLDLQRLATPFAEDPLLMDRNLVAAYAVQVARHEQELALSRHEKINWMRERDSLLERIASLESKDTSAKAKALEQTQMNASTGAQGGVQSCRSEMATKNAPQADEWASSFLQSLASASQTSLESSANTIGNYGASGAASARPSSPASPSPNSAFTPLSSGLTTKAHSPTSAPSSPNAAAPCFSASAEYANSGATPSCSSGASNGATTGRSPTTESPMMSLAALSMDSIIVVKNEHTSAHSESSLSELKVDKKGEISGSALGAATHPSHASTPSVSPSSSFSPLASHQASSADKKSEKCVPPSSVLSATSSSSSMPSSPSQLSIDSSLNSVRSASKKRSHPSEDEDSSATYEMSLDDLTEEFSEECLVSPNKRAKYAESTAPSSQKPTSGVANANTNSSANSSRLASPVTNVKTVSSTCSTSSTSSSTTSTSSTTKNSTLRLGGLLGGSNPNATHAPLSCATNASPLATTSPLTHHLQATGQFGLMGAHLGAQRPFAMPAHHETLAALHQQHQHAAQQLQQHAHALQLQQLQQFAAAIASQQQQQQQQHAVALAAAAAAAAAGNSNQSHAVVQSPPSNSQPAAVIATQQQDSSRRGHLPERAIRHLKTWFFAHRAHPYPSEDEKNVLMDCTGLSRGQINNWFTNARRRLLPKQAELAVCPNRTEQEALPSSLRAPSGPLPLYF